jgi:methylenetetrahydrofolate dehydrogenase (NADP+) / methenyltetrahydrofolate cyclohydrolase
MMYPLKKMHEIEKRKAELEIKSFDKSCMVAIIQVGNREESNRYVRNKIKDCTEVGIKTKHIMLSDKISEGDLIEEVYRQNLDDEVCGIIVQLPLPEHINEKTICSKIAAEKDIDGFRPDSPYQPCTPKAVVRIIYEILNQTRFSAVNGLRGRTVTIIGSGNVGKPLANLLIEEKATVIACNSSTKDIKKFTRCSDVVVSCVGKPNTVTPDMVHANCVVIDVGISFNSEGKMVGDVSPDCAELCIAQTPVPGGVGLITRAMFIRNAIEAYRRKND